MQQNEINPVLSSLIEIVKSHGHYTSQSGLTHNSLAVLIAAALVIDEIDPSFLDISSINEAIMHAIDTIGLINPNSYGVAAASAKQNILASGKIL